MKKQQIGVVRIILYLITVVFFTREFDNFNFEFWISDLIYGSHTVESRRKGIITLMMLFYHGILSFYSIQTLLYIFIGTNLQGKRTGLFRLIGLLISGIREAAQSPNFWTSSSTPVATDQIEKVLEYRDNKMALMSNREAVEFMKGTGHVDFMLTRPDLKQSRKTLSYLNNKMAIMDNESALKFIKGDEVN